MGVGFQPPGDQRGHRLVEPFFLEDAQAALEAAQIHPAQAVHLINRLERKPLPDERRIIAGAAFGADRMGERIDRAQRHAQLHRMRVVDGPQPLQVREEDLRDRPRASLRTGTDTITDWPSGAALNVTVAPTRPPAGSGPPKSAQETSIPSRLLLILARDPWAQVFSRNR